MILEYKTKTDSHRIAESVKWFEDIEDRYEINKTKYIYLEVILRQLFIQEKMNTAFFYENEKQIHLSKNITELRREIDYYSFKDNEFGPFFRLNFFWHLYKIQKQQELHLQHLQNNIAYP